jgi:threonine dehydrogenase-like Zn-dependent dehydrogenase
MLSVHLENGRVEVREAPRPSRSDGVALIRMLCAGICNTDLELQRGYYGFSGTPGHEFVGEVIEAGDRSLVGRRVVGEINLNCGFCVWCRRNLGRHCPNRTVLGIVKHPGAFGEFLTLPERNLRVVPDSVSTETAVFTEPLAAACEILEQAQIPCSSVVAVLGDGKLGLLISQVLNAHGFKVHQFGRHPEKLRISEQAGIETRIAGDALPTAEFQWVVEATGSPEGLRQAVRMTQPRGTVILKSTQHGMVGVDTAPVIVNEITLIGSRCGRFEPALELLGRGLINVADMISDRKKLSEAPRAFEQAARKGSMKVLLLCES